MDWNQVKIHRLTARLLQQQPFLQKEIENFEVPHDAKTATDWLTSEAARPSKSHATYLFLEDERLAGYFSLRVSEIELRQTERKRYSLGQHPQQGCILISWIAKNKESSVSAEHMVTAIAGIADLISDHVGVVALALDPANEKLANYWRTLGFKNTCNSHGGQLKRMWRILKKTGQLE